jgi:polyisoprenoid-binding protein YceI
VFAYRGGALARAGHNHVIASRHLQGELRLGDDATRAQFELTIPVSLLTIDEPELRAAPGADFATDVTDSAKDGTRKNMLSEALLDGERFPGIRLRMSAVELASTGYIASVETLVKDVPRVHRVPLTLERGAAEVVATGEFELKQSDLGLKPFSVMMGALAVQDAMRVRFRVVARAS